MNKKYEILEYLSKFLDETVFVQSSPIDFLCIGTCTKIEPMCNDSDIYKLRVTDKNNKVYTFHICTYDYKNQSWFDGHMQKTMYIGFY